MKTGRPSSETKTSINIVISLKKGKKRNRLDWLSLSVKQCSFQEMGKKMNLDLLTRLFQ
jgi:hypothetical protein